VTTNAIRQDAQVIHLELKYCERCGSLWLREADSAAIYCARCEAAIEHMAPATRHKNKARVPGTKVGAHLLPGNETDLSETDDLADAWTHVYGKGGAA
jgi:hypothetical protein